MVDLRVQAYIGLLGIYGYCSLDQIFSIISFAGKLTDGISSILQCATVFIYGSITKPCSILAGKFRFIGNLLSVLIFIKAIDIGCMCDFWGIYNTILIGKDNVGFLGFIIGDQEWNVCHCTSIIIDLIEMKISTNDVIRSSKSILCNHGITIMQYNCITFFLNSTEKFTFYRNIAIGEIIVFVVAFDSTGFFNSNCS